MDIFIDGNLLLNVLLVLIACLVIYKSDGMNKEEKTIMILLAINNLLTYINL